MDGSVILAELGRERHKSAPRRRDSLFPLDLDRGSVGIGGAGKDHEVATRDIVLAAHQLADWSDRIDDGCARGVGHEGLQWFQNAGARRFTRKRKQVWFSRIETSDRGLQYLH